MSTLPVKRGPHRFSDYRQVHETVMDHYRTDFIASDTLRFNDQGNGLIHLSGTIYCQGNLRIEVSKILAVVGLGSDPDVESQEYTYEAVLGGQGTVFRYCSPHLSHHQYHHKHTGQPLESSIVDEEGPAEVCGAEARIYPTLGDVIKELQQWYWDHLDRLTDEPPAVMLARE